MILDDIQPPDSRTIDRILSTPTVPPIMRANTQRRILLGTGLLALLLVVSALLFPVMLLTFSHRVLHAAHCRSTFL